MQGIHCTGHKPCDCEVTGNLAETASTVDLELQSRHVADVAKYLTLINVQ